VRWMTDRYLSGQGVARFIEVGAGSVLTGLLRNIDPFLKGVAFGNGGFGKGKGRTSKENQKAMAKGKWQKCVGRCWRLRPNIFAISFCHLPFDFF